MGIIQRLKKWAKSLKQEIFTLYFAYKDPRVPWYAKFLIFIVIAYALSPIDLIPDFIPLLGHLDDLILVPLGIAFAIHLIPADVLEECRKKAEKVSKIYLKASRAVAVVIVAFWLFVIGILIQRIVLPPTQP